MDGFKKIEEKEPKKGQYCEIKVVSYFKGWYLPECKSWSWLMDENAPPSSHVESWTEAVNKTGDIREFN